MAREQGKFARRRILHRMVPLVALASLGLVQWDPVLAAATGAPVAAPPSPGTARVWIYRDYEPYTTLARPYVRLNGAIAGISEPGGVFYRDLAPGTYAITVDSEGTDVQQFVSVPVAAGQQVYIKVLASASWDSGGGGGGEHGGGGGWARDTFYTWQVQAQVAAAEIARMPRRDGG